MTTQEIKDFIRIDYEAYCTEKGYSFKPDDDIEEYLTDGSVIYHETDGSHRWYDDTINVVKIGEKLFQFNGFHITGDNSASDMGLEFDWDTVCEVEAYEVPVIKYRPVK